MIRDEQEAQEDGWHERTEYLNQQLTIAKAIETAGTDGDATNPLWAHYDKIEKWRDFLIERFPKHSEWLQKFVDDQHIYEDVDGGIEDFSD